MNKKLQDYVWSVLPKEFKEEVKYKYNKTKTKKIKKECDLGFLNAHEGMFGVHNLTSDTEGEEMLCASKSKVIQFYSHLLDLVENERMSEHYSGWCDLEREYIALFGENVFADYFGSKCLPDEEPKPAEPTANYMQVDYHGADTAASTIADSCQSQPVTDYFDRIIKDGFRGHNRLHIAAQIVASMIGSDDWTTWRGSSNKEIWHNMAKSSLEIADALIAEAEKGGEK